MDTHHIRYFLAVCETLKLSGAQRNARVDELLTQFGLQVVRKSQASLVSGGERRKMEIARALVTNPRLILLDEPFSGVDPLAVDDVQNIIIELKQRGLGILITDHNVRETLSVVDRAYIIHQGKVMREGTSDFLIKDELTRQLYLGERFSM